MDAVNAGNSQSFQYDSLDRLTRATGAYGTIGYSYDRVGNRLGQTTGSQVSSYSYTNRTNQLSFLTTNGVVQKFSYTAAGNISTYSPSPNTSYNLTYNQAGRLTTATSASQTIAQYTYDAFGRRLTKSGATTTLYQYDSQGRLIEETDGQGNALADYIYLGRMPAATLSPGTGQIYYLHTDRMGTPQVATDANQAVVWTATYQPFGGLSSTPALIVQDLRLPGQENDSDTGWYHNGFRDYIPSLGRYLESDPMGLAAGPNTYAYAGGNPVRFGDPSGLDSGCPPTGDCFMSGGGVGAPAYTSDNTWNFSVPGPLGIFTPGLQNLANIANFLSTYHPLQTAYVGIGFAGGALAFAGSGAAAGGAAALETTGATESTVGTANAAATEPETQAFVYRGDSRPPDQIFNEGFKPWGDSTDLFAHALSNKFPPSNFVSTSKSFEAAEVFNSNRVYVVRPVNGIDVNATLGELSPFPSEEEIAIPGGVAPSDIRGITLPRLGYSIFNPNYIP